MDKKIHISVIILITLAVLTIFSLIAYGMFEYGIVFTGNKDNKITTCTIDMNLLEKDPINLVAAYPIDDSLVENYKPLVLTLTNSSLCEHVYYKVSLKNYCETCALNNEMCNVNNKNINCNNNYKIDSYLIKYEYKKQGDSNTIISNNIDNMVLTGTLDKTNTTVSYEIKLWISSAATNDDLYVYENDQILEDENGYFKTKSYLGKINLEIADTPF